MGFDITDLSISYNQNKLLEDVSIGMLAKSLDSMKTQGAGLEEILASADAAQGISAAAMELSVNPSIGGNVDVSV